MDDDDPRRRDLPGTGPDGGPSRSAAKREAHAVRDLGAELAALGESERRRMPLPEDVRAALEELIRIRARGARKRQLGYLAKRLRRVDTAPIEAALDALRQTARAATLDHHRVEAWRDRLLGDGPGETPKDALTAFLDEHPEADRQGLRRLQASALAERAAEPPRPPRAARELFRSVRDTLAAAREAVGGDPSEGDPAGLPDGLPDGGTGPDRDPDAPEGA